MNILEVVPMIHVTLCMKEDTQICGKVNIISIVQAELACPEVY